MLTPDTRPCLAMLLLRLPCAALRAPMLAPMRYSVRACLGVLQHMPDSSEGGAVLESWLGGFDGVMCSTFFAFLAPPHAHPVPASSSCVQMSGITHDITSCTAKGCSLLVCANAGVEAKGPGAKVDLQGCTVETTTEVGAACTHDPLLSRCLCCLQRCSSPVCAWVLLIQRHAACCSG